jgi:hypothetical protein
MQIKRYQTGGIVYTPFIKEQSDQQNINKNNSSNKSSSSDSDEVQKAIIKLLEESGLPNDVDYFLKQTNVLLSDNINYDGSTSYSMSDLIKLHSLANKIKHNNNSYAAAKDRMEAENSGSEVAITNTGKLYVQDENGELKTISVNSYYDNSDKYTILTQTDLMNFREYSPDLAYNSTILNDLNSAIGMGTIVSKLTDTINTFGTNTIEDKSDKLTIKEKGQVEKGMKNILEGSSPDGVYNISTTTHTAHQGYSSEEGLYEAASYL